MKEYIENIIEIVLENISCDHQADGDHSTGVRFDDTNYCLNNEKVVIEKCLKIVPRDLIEKAARNMHKAVYGSLMKCDFKCHMMEEFRKQIRALFEEES